MPRATTALAVFLISFTSLTLLHAGEAAAQEYSDAGGPPSAEADVWKKEYISKAAANTALLEAARRIVMEHENAEAVAYLDKAEAAAEEGRRHYYAGEYATAIEDLSESTRLSNFAIIQANSENTSIRELVMEERRHADADRKRERKETKARNGMLEAETFIRTAERLLSYNENTEARRDVDAAKKRIESSRAALASEDYDAALADIKEAYRLSTAAVKKIKRAEGAAVTYPRESTEEELFTRELMINDTRMLLTEEAIKEGDTEARMMLVEARELRKAAAAAMEKGRTALAIEKIKASNELLTRALEASSDEDESDIDGY